MKWIVDNGIVKSEDNCLFPNAKEIYDSTDIICLSGKEYEFSIENIRISKLVSLNYKLVFDFENGKIELNAYAVHKNKEYIIVKNKERFIDYIIIDGVWFYLNPTIEQINIVLDSLQIKTIDDIDVYSFLKLKKELIKQDADFEDNAILKLQKYDFSNLIHNYEINGKLFPYQEIGVKWLTYMTKNGCGCILGDQPGLGKTLQIISLMNNIKKESNNSHFLIVAPVSLLENWKREIDKFCPSLKTLVNYGKERINYYKFLLDYDVIITSYNGIQSGFSMYKMITWDIVALDEAQAIKNPNAKRTEIAKELNKKIGIAISGTPFENHLTDVWSITDFVMPDYLGDLKSFSIDYSDDICSATDLEQYITPIMLRRKVIDVANDLPNRVDIPQPIQMTIDEAKYYNDGLTNVKELSDLRLDKIQQLRMFCTHPSVYDDSFQDIDPIKLSYKYQRCCEIVEEIVENREKVIIFTSFNKMIDLLVKDLKERFSIPTLFINGSIGAQDRQLIIDDFSSIEGAAILILNPKAAGAGLNITAANHVIHYNLEWNPAVEDQASARAYRRGQSKTVFVYRLFYMNTIEEIINERIERKRELSDSLIVGNQGDIEAEDLAKILKIKPDVS